MRDGYLGIGVGARDETRNALLKCRFCGEHFTLYSNAAVIEELTRLGATARQQSAPACKNSECDNRDKGLDTHPKEYQRFGTSAAGSVRYRCKRCRTTMSIRVSATHRLRRSDKTEQILSLLVNKVPMRRLCEVAGIGPQLLYQRIDRLALQCRSFLVERETQFLAQERTFRQLHISTDRQDHALNWGSILDRRPTFLHLSASADSRSGYILDQHLNYDLQANPLALELAAREEGDPDLPLPFRRYARLWLPHEMKPDDSPTGLRRLPGEGAIVHEQYSTAAHVLSLKRWIDRSAYVQWSVDRDPSLGRFCVTAYVDRVRELTLDVFFVRINKSMTVAERHRALATAEAELAALRRTHSEKDDFELVRHILGERYREVRTGDRPGRPGWTAHPYPTMSEPERQVQCLTDDGRREVSPIVAGLGRASLRAIDRYFMQVRRKINLLERPIHTSGGSFRAWYGYTAYSPRVVMHVLDIFRTVYNCHLRGKDQKTPAQRIGLLQKRVALSELCAQPI